MTLMQPVRNAVTDARHQIRYGTPTNCESPRSIRLQI